MSARVGEAVSFILPNLSSMASMHLMMSGNVITFSVRRTSAGYACVDAVSQLDVVSPFGAVSQQGIVLLLDAITLLGVVSVLACDS